MKNLTLVALLLIAMTHASMATPKHPDKTSTQLSITSSPDSQKKAIIRVDNLIEGRKSFLKIKDKKGRLLHAETIHDHSSFTKAYDFSKVGGNEYIVEVRTKEGVTSQTFTIKEEKNKALYFKPVIRTESNLIKVVFKNPLSEPLSLNLYDKYGQEIYKTRISSQEVFATGLDVSRVRSHHYKLSIRNSDYVFTKNISLQ